MLLSLSTVSHIYSPLTCDKAKYHLQLHRSARSCTCSLDIAMSEGARNCPRASRSPGPSPVPSKPDASTQRIANSHTHALCHTTPCHTTPIPRPGRKSEITTCGSTSGAQSTTVCRLRHTVAHTGIAHTSRHAHYRRRQRARGTARHRRHCRPTSAAPPPAVRTTART